MKKENKMTVREISFHLALEEKVNESEVVVVNNLSKFRIELMMNFESRDRLICSPFWSVPNIEEDESVDKHIHIARKSKLSDSLMSVLFAQDAENPLNTSEHHRTIIIVLDDEEVDSMLDDPRPMRRSQKCCICGEDLTGYRKHNPYPIYAHGGCCDICNSYKVIPARLFIGIETAKVERNEKQYQQ